MHRRTALGADRPNALSAAVRDDLALIYVPNNISNTVSVIDPATNKVMRTVKVPSRPNTSCRRGTCRRCG